MIFNYNKCTYDYDYDYDYCMFAYVTTILNRPVVTGPDSSVGRA